jgi:predicted PurR-regulated permease PerM
MDPSSVARAAADDDVPDVVPRILRVSAALGWRLLVVVAALYVIGIVVSYVAAVVVPVAIALLLAALLAPAVRQLQNRQVPRGLATAIVLIGGLALLGGVLAFVVVTFVRGVPDLATQLTASINDIAAWLRNGPLQLSDSQLSRFQTEILNTLSANQASITAGALTTAATVGETLTEILLVVFTLIFFPHGGWIWQFLLGIVPNRVRNRVDVAGRRGLAALVSYVRATAVVATVDALAIGIALAVLGIPLAVPLAALVFLGAFIPIIGAVVAGAVAVMIALVAQGLVSALIVLGVVIAVMQLRATSCNPCSWARREAAPVGGRAVDRDGPARRGIAARCSPSPAGRAELGDPLAAQRGGRARRPEDVHTSEPEDRARRAGLSATTSHPDHALVRRRDVPKVAWVHLPHPSHLACDCCGAGGRRRSGPSPRTRQGRPDPCTSRRRHRPTRRGPSRARSTARRPPHRRGARRPGSRGGRDRARRGVAAHLPAAELLDDAGGIVDGDGRVRVAVEGDHGTGGPATAPAAPAHGGEGRRDVGGGALRSPECTPTAANTSGYAAPNTAAIAAPAEPATYTRSRSTPCSTAISSTIPARIDGSQHRGLVGGLEPVPVPHRVRGGDLLEVGDEEPVLLRQLAHPRGGGEVVGALCPAVQHTTSGRGPVPVVDVERVRPGTGRAP